MTRALSIVLSVLAVAAANLIPRTGPIVSSNDGVTEWWYRHYGWPWTAYGQMGYTERPAQHWWNSRDLAFDFLLGLAIVGSIVVLAQAIFHSRRRCVSGISS